MAKLKPIVCIQRNARNAEKYVRYVRCVGWNLPIDVNVTVARPYGERLKCTAVQYVQQLQPTSVEVVCRKMALLLRCVCCRRSSPSC